MGRARKRRKAQQAWKEKFAAYEKAYPDLAAEFKRRLSGELPENWEQTTQAYIEKLQAEPAKIATRKASQNALNTMVRSCRNCSAAPPTLPPVT
jgi:transketolase